MAEDRTTVRYEVNPKYGEGERTPSNTVIASERTTKTIRVSANGATLDYGGMGETELLATMSVDQLHELITKGLELLTWMAGDSLRWAKQLEDADIKPEEV